jgi:peptidoglycan/LPS O-acetylase OafA/YrhL
VTVTTDEVIVRGLLRTRRIPRSARLCSTALGTSLFIARVQRRRRPVPMLTPWLVLTATLGVVVTTVKILSDYPQLEGALFAGGAAICVAALAVCFLADRGN